MITMIKECIILLAVTVCGVSAECYYLELEHAYNYDVNGIWYIYDYNQCSGRNTYRHIDRPLYLYHINGWWVVHDVPCDDDGINVGRVRGHDGAMYPELVIEFWDENYNGLWTLNAAFDPDCYYGPSALSTVAVICISIACFLVVVGIIALPIVLCMKKDSPSRASTPEPAAVMPLEAQMMVPGPQPTYIQLAPSPGEQPPPYTEPQQGVPLTTNPEMKAY